MGIILIDVNYEERYVLFEITTTGESFKVSFEYIQDINRYITKEWGYNAICPKNKL